MPRVKSAASLARERLKTGTDVTPDERIALLQIISVDDRQKKQLQRAKLDAGTGKRYTKKAKQAVEPTKTHNRNISKPAPSWVKDRPMAEAIADMEEPEIEVASVATVEPPAAKPTPAVAPVPPVASFIY